ncbi:MAG: VTT domain-containing protein [Dehalococcoidia bacterium]
MPEPTASERAAQIEREGYSELAEQAGRERYSDREKKAIAFYEWAARTLEQHLWVRIVAGVAVAAIVLTLTVGVLLLPLFGVNEDTLGDFGYPGIFLANLLSTSTVFIPVPGLTAAGQALIIDQASERNPILVGFLGGLGMGLGEITAYIVGLGGGQVARGREFALPGRLEKWMEKVARWVNWLMGHYGTLTLFSLSAIPNPAFEFAGITAGAIQFPFRRFLIAVTLGKIVRGMILAAIGYYSLDLFGL